MGEYRHDAIRSRTQCSSAVVKCKVLSIGGVDNNGNLLASSELYSSSSGKWALTGSMSQARQVFPAVVLSNKKVLVSGGLGASGTVLAAAELYHPTTGAWSSAGSLSVARFAHTATVFEKCLPRPTACRNPNPVTLSG
jgi:hypothetical protein